MASPVCGVPLLPFFVGSAVGTQLSLLFLSLSGAKLREVGEKGFDLRTVQASMVQLGLVMGVLQCVPLLLIWLQKKKKRGEAEAAAGREKKKGAAAPKSPAKTAGRR